MAKAFRGSRSVALVFGHFSLRLLCTLRSVAVYYFENFPAMLWNELFNVFGRQGVAECRAILKYGNSALCFVRLRSLTVASLGAQYCLYVGVDVQTNGCRHEQTARRNVLSLVAHPT